MECLYIAQPMTTDNSNWRRPTALIIGRFQPFHEGHKALVLEAIRRVKRVCIGVRSTEGIDDKNPYSFSEVRKQIEAMMPKHLAQIEIIQIPNITHVFYGRDVGYAIERIDLSPELQAISATKIRALAQRKRA